jgi:hypothetical protein
MEIILVIGFCTFLFLLMQGGSEAFGKTTGTFMGIAFLGFLVLFGGGAIILLIAPILVTIGAPILILLFILWVITRIFK